MKLRLAAAFAVILLLATAGWNMTWVGNHEPERVARAGLTNAVDDHALSAVSPSADRGSLFALSELASALKEDDAASLRLQLIACLFTMLVVTVGTLVGICYFEQWAARRSRRHRRATPE
jgi:hypothetical protein